MHEQPITRLLALLKDTYKEDGTIKAFYNGDPGVIPAMNLPALAVSKLRDTTRVYDRTSDEVAEEIVIKVIYDKKADYTVQSDTEQLTEQKIRDFVEARDPETGTFKEKALKRILRSGLPNGLTLVGDIDFRLGELPRTKNLTTAEGHVIVRVQDSVRVE